MSERVDEIGHPVKCQDNPLATLDFLVKLFGKPIVMAGVMK